MAVSAGPGVIHVTRSQALRIASSSRLRSRPAMAWGAQGDRPQNIAAITVVRATYIALGAAP